MINKNKLAPVLAVIVTGFFLTVILFSGCSSGTKKGPTFQVAFCAQYVNEKAVSEYGSSLTAKMPELTIEGRAPQFMAMQISTGQTRNEAIPGGSFADPMMVMGGIVRISSMVAAGELDVVIADMENAARDARGSMYLPLKDAFSEAELAATGRDLLSFDIVDTASETLAPTGEKTPVYGIDITDNEQLKAIFGNREIGVFIIANTKNLELAKKLVLSLAAN